ncbi:dihydrofolate reductase [Paludisphaera rhizosphaerae]|uniref:dihydrofolate reductase n=1 Tax=Paludisphaera rhizosphaerae TaxID=2711216 RepID=UPI0013EA0F29|nr:dihydrofolate reductase [Paludisphaera rhizosphaerae]
MDVSLIVAMTKDRVIGREGDLPWRLPRDLKHFRRLTMGKPIIMGRKTYESLGRALPGRLNIVLSKGSITTPAGVLLAHSASEALEFARREGAAEAMVIGGGQVYREFLDRCRTIHLTLVAGDFEGDAFFPIDPLDSPDWRIVHEEDWPADADNLVDARYIVLQRRPDA